MKDKFIYKEGTSEEIDKVLSNSVVMNESCLEAFIFQAVICVACRYKHLKSERIIREDPEKAITVCPLCQCGGYIKCEVNP